MDEQYCNEAVATREPFYSKLDRRIKECETEIEFFKSRLTDTEHRLSGLKNLRKMITSADEKKIQALIEAGLV